MTREIDVLRLVALAMAAHEKGNLQAANELIALAIQFSGATSEPIDQQQQQRQPKRPKTLRSKK
jgi:hypothetical protein